MNHYTNKKSLALLGHGKWKSALGHTLLIIGMVLMSMGAYAQTPSGGMYMHKTWIPDENDHTGSKGEIMLETFVTGESIITQAHVPTDIVVVVDQSGSMDETMSDGTKRIDALKAALNGFVANVKQDAIDNSCDHRIAIVGFASAPVSNYNSYSNTELLTPSEISYENIQNQNYIDALVYANVNGSINPVLTNAITNIAASGGTVMHYGLIMANNILSKREITEFDPDNNPNTHNNQPRTQVVVFFTDGYPGLYSPEKTNGGSEMFAEHRYTNNGTSSEARMICAQTVADLAVTEAKTLKQNGAIVYSVGIFDGASPSSDYQTQLKYYSQSGPVNYDETNWANTTQTQRRYYYAPELYAGERTRTRRYSWSNWGEWSAWSPTDNDLMYWEPATEPTSGNSGDAAANGLLHFISSNYAANEIESSTGTPWAAMTIQAHPAGDHNNGKYLAASSSEELANIFESIASESGGEAYSLDPSTVIHDEISSSFQLTIPAGYEGDLGNLIRAYAPKFKRKNGNEMVFEPITDGANNTRLTMGTDEHGNEHVVTGGTENRLPDGIVQYDDDSQVLTFTNFNFSAMWCGYQEEGTTQTAHGRKLVMFIPIELADGSWGDGIATNGPVSLIYPDGSTSDPLLFNVPTANVLGSVWTEVVTHKPADFDPMDIDSPEDLAWFISHVNGRIGYNVTDPDDNTNNVASHPDASGRLTADIDMSAHNWVPIGSGWQVEIGNDGLTQFKMENGQKVHMVYEGTFDGNGHVITGLKNNASKFYKQITQNVGGVVVFPGMFSDVSGTVKNVFVLDADFRGKHHNANFVHHGIIADTLEVGGLIFNCEAAGRITCNNDDVTNDSQLIYGGLVGLNNGGTIHSCMAMAELTAYTMGGMIGENRGSFSNGFTNGVYNYLNNGVTGKYAGGIAATSTGSINNCYVRFERENQNLDKVIFGQITGSGNFTNAYSPADLANMVPTSSIAGTDTYTNTLPAQWLNRNGQNNLLVTSGESMLEALEDEKDITIGEETITGASWKRTTAKGYEYSLHGGNINGDYPVLKFDDYTCLGSADGIRIDYAATMKEMLHRHNTGNMNESTGLGENYKVNTHPAINAGTIDLYANDALKAASAKAEDASYFSNDADVVVYIDEDVSLLQDANSTIVGFTGQTLKNFASEGGERWHNISSSLSNSMFGWTYTGDPAVGDSHTTGENVQHAHSWETNPCGMRFNQNDDDTEIFPADFINYHHGDFYCFYEPQYHWINFRRHSNCHWHMDNYEVNIPYTNEDHFIPGKGYLMAINADQNNVNRPGQFIQNRGTLNNGDFEIEVTYTASNEWTGLAGYNLLGNPYQSYLDFDAFVAENATLLSNSDFANTYGVYNPQSDIYEQYKSGSSKGSRAAGKYLNMHQGFFIQVNATGTATFTNDMRSNDGTPCFRGEQPAYPLINFILTDYEGNTDLAILELNRPENDGARKLRMGSPAGRIYFRYDNENLAIYFRNSDKDYQSLNFAAEEDGNFTLNWERANDNFNSLTLVDNVTGIKTDMLTHDHYTFEGRVSDYNSRFKIVFGEMDNDEEEPVLEHFAFFDHGNLIVNGTGHFEVVDVLGRVVYSAELTDTQNTVSLPGNVRGVCMLCFTRNNETKVQKMVIQ